MLNIKKRWKSLAVLLAVLSAFLFAAESCDDTQPSTSEQAATARSKGVDEIRKNQPVQPMHYSATLETINRWSTTWGVKDKISYVYMKRADGSIDGYYVLDGLPVSYCVGGSPPYTYEDVPGDGNYKVQLPAPGLDGAYYGGCNSDRYYGYDAVTGQYVEYTDGMILTAVLSDQPLPQQADAYISSIEDVKNRN